VVVARKTAHGRWLKQEERDWEMRGVGGWKVCRVTAGCWLLVVVIDREQWWGWPRYQKTRGTREGVQTRLQASKAVCRVQAVWAVWVGSSVFGGVGKGGTDGVGVNKGVKGNTQG